MREIAAKVGCSHASVSRALRGEKKVGEKLRTKIVKVAEEMGYKPNPMIASLMSARMSKRHRNNLVANIGWLNTHFEKDFWLKHDYNRAYVSAAENRAKELGYGFEEIWAAEEGLSGNRLTDIAHARGVQGFIIPGPFEGPFTEDFDTDAFAFTCLQDHQRGQYDWNRATASRRRNIISAYQALQGLGYRRIGCVIGVSETRDGFEKKIQAYNEGLCRTLDFSKQEIIGAILSGYHYVQDFVPKEDRLRLFFYERVSQNFHQTLAKYLAQVRPEAVICNDRAVERAAQIAGLKIPEDLAVAHLDLKADVAGWAGINIYPDRQGAAAIDQLTSQIERNERGVPPFSKRTSIEGDWVDGWTAPKR